MVNTCLAKTKLRKELKVVVEKLKKEYRPQKIILFGSTATNQIHNWSDLDIIIIKPTKKRFYDRIGEVNALLPHNVPLDLLVYTPKEFKRMTKDNLFIRQEILEKGKIVYEVQS